MVWFLPMYSYLMKFFYHHFFHFYFHFDILFICIRMYATRFHIFVLLVSLLVEA